MKDVIPRAGGKCFARFCTKKNAKKDLTDMVYCVSGKIINHKFDVYKVFNQEMTENSLKTGIICVSNWCKLLSAINLHILQKEVRDNESKLVLFYK